LTPVQTASASSRKRTEVALSPRTCRGSFGTDQPVRAGARPLSSARLDFWPLSTR
jgi:hypothetical protein